MGFRLSKIYTRKGDNGTTGLGTGKRIDKDSLRMCSIGEIDELNCAVGMVRSLNDEIEIDLILKSIQHDLFDLGGELAMPEHSMIDQKIIDQLEFHIDNLNNDLQPLRNFILPAGKQIVTTCHLARAICRRTERTLVTFNKNESQPHLLALSYINRLSDLLFVLCRVFSYMLDDKEIYWESRHVR